MVEKIRFQISPDGEVSVNVECVEGSRCEQITHPFEEKIGTVFQKNYKDSYYVNTTEDSLTLETQEDPQ